MSVPGNYVLVRLEGSDEKIKVFFGEPLLINPPRGDVAFDILVSASDKPAGHVQRRRDDTSNPVPSEVLSLLRPGGYERSAVAMYRGLASGQKTEEFDAKVVQLRVAGARKVAARYDDPRKLVELLQLHTMNAMPGDNEVFPLLADRIGRVLPSLVDIAANAAEFKQAAWRTRSRSSGRTRTGAERLRSSGTLTRTPTTPRLSEQPRSCILGG